MIGTVSHTANSDNTVVLSVDAMGGDQGPSEIIAGIGLAIKENPDVHFLVHGPEYELKFLINKRKINSFCTIINVKGVVQMTDKPSHVMRYGKDTSMWSAITSVKQQKADACVSCGNTGALMAVSMIRLRKLPGINRPAIAILFPCLGKNKFNVMLDVGADIRADENDLLQYALMGASYSRNGMGIVQPRVGLLNVGTEENKGRAELKIAHDLIQDMSTNGSFEFIGFVEGDDIPSSKVDVIVTDGFTGNIALKSAEGTAGFIASSIRSAFKYNLLSNLAGLAALGPLRRLKESTDPRRANGGLFLGLNGTVVKSHGAADATGIAAAIGLAYRLGSAKFTTRLAARVASVSGYHEDTEEDGK